MIGDHSLLQLVLQASLVVQIVLALLVIASVVSWAIIGRKRRLLRQARAAADEFEDRFWSGIDLAELYRSVDATTPVSGMAGIFASGFREFSRLRQQARARRRAAARGQSPHDEGRAAEGDRPPGGEPRDARDHRLDQPLRRVSSAPCGAS